MKLAIDQQRLVRELEALGEISEAQPPVVTRVVYTPADVRRENYYLCVSAFAPYKRLDLALSACNRLRRPLVVIGNGQDERRLRAQAGPAVRFLGWQPEIAVRDHLLRDRG